MQRTKTLLAKKMAQQSSQKTTTTTTTTSSSTSTSKTTKITILGAGIAGLTLGRCLVANNHGIRTAIYDRAPAGGPSTHDYGITLHASAYRPLLGVLGLDEAGFRRAVAVDCTAGGVGQLGSAGELSSSFRANRRRLERLLGEGLDVRWEQDVAGKIADGIAASSSSSSAATTSTTTTTGDAREGLAVQGSQEFGLVVAADGVHSALRKSLLSHRAVDPTVLPFVVFNGKRRVARQVFEEVFRPTMCGASIVESRRAGGVMLQLSVNKDEGGDKEVSVSWVYSRRARAGGDACFTPDRSTAEAKSIPQAFFKEVEALGELEQPFREIFADLDLLKRDRILSWLMRTTEVGLSDLQDLARKGVVFVGDAVHAQPIVGGQGANDAIADAVSLAGFIADKGTDGVAEWYGQRYPAWKESVARSKEAIEDMHMERKPVL